ncbi:division/cell wall cluster transcriptional repressor MraZ [Candidatus Curtissbacteria bacterium]|nr:division/cell wall cluster transcriptional repressor MraZ [Candidatus Curtissbacteria bacterium]
MFLGSYKPSFDAKTRRIALPKKIRESLTLDETILSFGFEKCIFGFSKSDWERESQRRVQDPLTDRKSRDVRRFIFSGAEHVVLDNQGRIVLSDSLCQYAKITTPVVVGAGDHFEIWDEENWNREKKKLEEVVL